MYLDHALISVFLSSFAPSLRDAIRVCVRYNVVHLPENSCKDIFRGVKKASEPFMVLGLLDKNLDF
jgi:hypothetical protein